MGIFIRQVVPLGILVLAQQLVMAGQFRSICSGGGVIPSDHHLSDFVKRFPGLRFWFFVPMALMIGTGIGLFNGYMVTSARVSA